jgi:hypothetical protein
MQDRRRVENAEADQSIALIWRAKRDPTFDREHAGSSRDETPCRATGPARLEPDQGFTPSHFFICSRNLTSRKTDAAPYSPAHPAHFESADVRRCAAGNSALLPIMLRMILARNGCGDGTHFSSNRPKCKSLPAGDRQGSAERMANGGQTKPVARHGPAGQLKCPARPQARPYYGHHRSRGSRARFGQEGRISSVTICPW